MKFWEINLTLIIPNLLQLCYQFRKFHFCVVHLKILTMFHFIGWHPKKTFTFYWPSPFICHFFMEMLKMHSWNVSIHLPSGLVHRTVPRHLVQMNEKTFNSLTKSEDYFTFTDNKVYLKFSSRVFYIIIIIKFICVFVVIAIFAIVYYSKCNSINRNYSFIITF